MTPPPRRYASLSMALVVIAVSQWLGTSLWFSPAGVAEGLVAQWQLSAAQFAWLIAATQLGFIAGSLVLAVTGMADRWPASRLFACSCLAGAVFNVLLVLAGVSYPQAWVLRALVGVALAGIYPLGMKMIVQWVGGKPALALAWLVGMLTLGTAMPHALRAFGVAWPWEFVLGASSLMATLGGAAVWRLGDGPHASGVRSSGAGSSRFQWRALRVFAEVPALKASALGYFGHMWELYAFWSVVPVLCMGLLSPSRGLGIAHDVGIWLPAMLIGVGALGCLVGGWLAQRVGSAAVAMGALAGSGLVCAIYPLLPESAFWTRLCLLLAWGTLVIADSPQFSAMSAQAAPAQELGLVLVFQNGLGFIVSVVSIVVLSWALTVWGERALWLLLPGPVFGVLAMRSQWRALKWKSA